MAIVANKIDVEARVVSSQAGKEFAAARLLPYFEVSAKENRKI